MTNSKIIKVAEPIVGEEEVEAVRKVLLSGNYVSGKKVEEFENEFADYVGVSYAVAVSSGTDADAAAQRRQETDAGDHNPAGH